MRYKNDHKAQTRDKIVQVASRKFRESGINGVGVATLMSQACLTHGGFYAHFKSKEALLQDAVKEAFDQILRDLAESGNGSSPSISQIARHYLSKSHLTHPQHGCAAASLASEVSRHPANTRKVLNNEVQRMLDLIVGSLKSIPEEQKQQRATAIFSLMMGTIQLARLEPSDARANQILSDGIDAVMALSQ